MKNPENPVYRITLNLPEDIMLSVDFSAKVCGLSRTEYLKRVLRGDIVHEYRNFGYVLDEGEV